jgi:hypothetical protein
MLVFVASLPQVQKLESRQLQQKMQLNPLHLQH